MSEHTPGPWGYRPYGDSHFTVGADAHGQDGIVEWDLAKIGTYGNYATTV